MHGEIWEEMAIRHQLDKMLHNTRLPDVQEELKAQTNRPIGREKHTFGKQTWQVKKECEKNAQTIQTKN